MNRYFLSITDSEGKSNLKELLFLKNIRRLLYELHIIASKRESTATNDNDDEFDFTSRGGIDRMLAAPSARGINGLLQLGILEYISHDASKSSDIDAEIGIRAAAVVACHSLSDALQEKFPAESSIFSPIAVSLYIDTLYQHNPSISEDLISSKTGQSMSKYVPSATGNTW